MITLDVSCKGSDNTHVVHLLRQSTGELEPTVFRSSMRHSTRRSLARQRWLRPTLRVLLAALLVMSMAYVISLVVIQTLVDASELSLKQFRLSDPESGSLYVNVRGGHLSTAVFPVECSLEDLIFELCVDDQPVGAMVADNVPLGYGGNVPVVIAGRLHITHKDGFKQLSEAIVTQPEVHLSIKGTITVRTTWLGIPFRGIRFVKHLVMKGANGLDVRMRKFELLDAQNQPFGSNSTTRQPLHLEMIVDAYNPSDFEFIPLGQLEYRVYTASGSPFAMTATAGSVSLTHGSLSYMLSGHLQVPPEGKDEFEELLVEYAAGRPADLIPVFHRVTGQPIYHEALKGMRLYTVLPGIPGGVHMFKDIAIHPDVLASFGALASLNPFEQNHVVSEKATLLVRNPFNITTEVTGIFVKVMYKGGYIGKVDDPHLVPSIHLTPFEAKVPGEPFVLQLNTSVATLERLLVDLVADGEVIVDLESKLYIRVGDIDDVALTYNEPNMSVALGDLIV